MIRRSLGLAAMTALLACGGASTQVAPVDGDACAACADAAPAVGFQPVWAISAGDGAGQLGDAIAIEPSGDILIGGEFGGAMDFRGGVALRATDGAAANGFVVKLDSAGHPRWARGFGGDNGGEQRVRVVAHGAMGIVIGGYFSGALDCGTTVLISAGGSDAFLAVLAEDGTTRACVRFGDAEHQSVTGIAIAPDGRIVVAGEFAGTIDLGGGPLTSAGQEDLFVATFDAALAHVWSKRFGGIDVERLPRIAVATSGRIGLAAIYRETFDLGGAPLPSRIDGGLVAVLDGGGGHVFSHGFVGDRHESPVAVAFDAEGDFVVGGRFSGNADFGSGVRTSASGDDAFVASWDASGAARWSVRFGGDGEDSVNGLAIDAAGHVHVCGELTTSLDGLIANGGPDAYVAELDDHGGILFRLSFGDEQEQHAYRLALLEGAPVVVGSFFGALDFGRAGRLVSNGGFDLSAGDLFVVRFARQSR